MYKEEMARAWWSMTIPGYAEANRNQKKKMKAEYKKSMDVKQINKTLNQLPLSAHEAAVNQICAFMGMSPRSPSYGAKSTAYDNIPNVKEVSVMNTNNPNTELVKREYLNTQLYHVKSKKDADLRKHFHMEDDERPRTFKEFVQRIKDGKFTVPKHILQDDDENFDDSDHFFDAYYPTSHIRWRDPKHDPDVKGYKLASEKMSTASKAIEREIMVLDLEKALKALEAFESKTFH